MINNRLFNVIAVAVLLSSSLFGQTPDPLKPTVLRGDVVSIDATKIVLKTDKGSVDVLLSEKTDFKRVPPETPALRSAVAAARGDIGDGDKLVVTGIISADGKSLPARAVYLMTKSDIAQKAQKESDRWRTRGVSGKVIAVNVPANQITLEVRGLINSSSVVLTPKADAKFLRYAPNSVKYSEAVASSITELTSGDMVRALGDRSPDGSTFTAEEVVSGAFQTVAGTVKSVDSAKNEIVVTNAQTKKDVIIDLGSASLLKKLPEEFANRLAQGGGRPGAGGAPAAGAGTTAATPPGGGAGANGAGGGRGGFGGGRASIDEMLERFPSITAADLKAGDVIAVSSTKSSNLDRITAIKLLAGVEPFLRAAQAAGAANGQRGARGTGDFTIPGLDGFGGP